MSTVEKPKAVRKPRVKKQPSQAEILKKCEEEIAEMQEDLDGLTQDQQRIAGQNLKNISALVADEIEELTEELNELKTQYEELKAQPAQV